MTSCGCSSNIPSNSLMSRVAGVRGFTLYEKTPGFGGLFCFRRVDAHPNPSRSYRAKRLAGPNFATGQGRVNIMSSVQCASRPKAPFGHPTMHYFGCCKMHRAPSRCPWCILNMYSTLGPFATLKTPWSRPLIESQFCLQRQEKTNLHRLWKDRTWFHFDVGVRQGHVLFLNLRGFWYEGC